MVQSIAAIYEVPSWPLGGSFDQVGEFVIFADEQAGILNAIGRVRPIPDIPE